MKNTININLFMILIIAGIGLFLNVGSYGVIESSDARYAEISRAMLIDGDYIHPNLMNIHHYHKPPFTYQISALGMKIFGVNEFGVRFFLQIAILLQLILVYKLSMILFKNDKSALLAVVIYFSFPMVLSSSRNLTTDAFLTLFVMFSIFSWVQYRLSGLSRYLYLFALSLGLGMLTKGPVVFIVSIPFIIAFNLKIKPKLTFSYHHIMAFLLFLLVGFSWYLFLVYENKDFLMYFLNRQTVERFSRNVFDRSEPFWYFLAYAPLFGIPWIITIPFLLKNSEFPKNKYFMVILIGILIPLLFFSISSSKRILYVLPIYHLLAIFIAELFMQAKGRTKFVNNMLLIFFSLISVMYLLSAFFITKFIFSQFVIFLTVALFLFIFVLHYRKIEIYKKVLMVSLVIALYLLITASSYMSLNQIEVNSMKPITDFIKSHNLEKRNILIYNTRKPSIAFELNKSVISLNAGNKGLMRETQFEKDMSWKKYLIDMSNPDEVKYLQSLLNEDKILIIKKKKINERNKWLIEKFQQSQDFGKWVLFY